MFDAWQLSSALKVSRNKNIEIKILTFLQIPMIRFALPICGIDGRSFFLIT